MSLWVTLPPNFALQASRFTSSGQGHIDWKRDERKWSGRRDLRPLRYLHRVECCWIHHDRCLVFQDGKEIGSPGGPRSRTDRVKACYAARLHYGGVSCSFRWRESLAVPTGAAPAVSALTTRRVCCFSSGPEDREKIGVPAGICTQADAFAQRHASATPRELLKLVAATGIAPGSRPLQGRANLSQLCGRKGNGPTGRIRTRNLTIIGRALYC